MIKMPNKSTSLLAVAAFAASTFALPALAQTQDLRGIWKNSNGITWKNSFGECWRSAYTSPAEATVECDPDLVPKPAPPAPPPPPPPPKPAAPPPPPPPAVAPAPAPKPPAPPPPPAPVTEKVTLNADVLFDFDKSV